jgi:hypothetical protein
MEVVDSGWELQTNEVEQQVDVITEVNSTEHLMARVFGQLNQLQLNTLQPLNFSHLDSLAMGNQ